MSNPHEFYETPTTFTRYLFTDMSARGLAINGRLFEPCVGSGAISGTVGGKWRTNDIDPRWAADTHLDAAKGDAWFQCGSVDWTVTNPPFSKWLEVARLAICHSRVGVAMHLRASVHEVLKTGERRYWLSQNPPTGILWLPRFAYQRSKTTGKWTTDSVCACWVIWMADRTIPQFIDYAPPSVIDELEAETPAFRARMDALMVPAKTAEVLA